MVRKILKYPNKDLELVSKDVKVFDSELFTLLDDLHETMVESKGVGIASIQVGIPLNVLIIKHDGELIEAINPEIIQSIGVQYKPERSLSLPGVSGIVERASSVEVKYIDRDGDKCSMVADDFLARVWQHLIENLKGGLYIDNLPNGKLKRLLATYKKANK